MTFFSTHIYTYKSFYSQFVIPPIFTHVKYFFNSQLTKFMLNFV